jgi:hypothetical protein
MTSTPEEITALFALAMEDFPHITGQPSDDHLNAIRLKVMPLLQAIEYDANGTKNLFGLVEDPTTYITTWGQAWVNPTRPAPYDTTIADDAPRVVQNRMEAAHRVRLTDYTTFLATEKAVAKFI